MVVLVDRMRIRNENINYILITEIKMFVKGDDQRSQDFRLVPIKYSWKIMFIGRRLISVN